MRAVSFVERLEFDLPSPGGSVFKNAIALGDVDNDSAMELVVGSDCGEVLIFKGNYSKCWRKACDLGMVIIQQLILNSEVNNFYFIY